MEVTINDPDHEWARIYRMIPAHRMQNVGAMCEYDRVHNIVYVNEGEYSYLKTDEDRHAAIRHVCWMPLRK
jgi:hypothetical protein